MSLKIEVAELMNQPGRVYDIAEKTQYGLVMNSEEKEASQVMDAWARDVIDKNDPEREIAQFITRTIQDELYNAPDELLSSMFRMGTVGEFDDYQANYIPQNTLVAHEAAKGGNVDRSYLNFKTITPTWKNLQVNCF